MFGLLRLPGVLRLIAVAWPVPVVAGLLVVGGRGPLFAVVTLALFWPLSLAFLTLWGPRPAAGAGLVCSALLAAQFFLPPPVIQAQRVTLERRFSESDQIARHRIKLPDSAESRWGLSTRRPPPQPYLYVSIVNRLLGADPPLRVSVGALDLGRATRQTRTVAQYRGAESEVYWHRFPLPIEALVGHQVLDVQVTPDTAAGFAPGAVGLMGGYSYRPSLPPSPSAFFDRGVWHLDSITVLPGEGHPPGFLGPVRYHVELRVLDPVTRQFVEILY